MLSKLFTVTLGALSFITDGAVPSCQNQGQRQRPALSRLQAAQVGPSVTPKPGTYVIQSTSFGSAQIRTYSVGQPLFASLTREFPGDFGTFELAPIEGSDTEFGLKNVGQSASVVIDGDNKFVTTTTDSDPQGFTLESTETENYFIVRTTDGTDRVWTLNPEEGPVVQRIILAPQDDDELVNAQRFQFNLLSDWVASDGHSAQATLALSKPHASDASSISPGIYMIYDSFVYSLVRSYAVGQDIFAAATREFPGDFGIWTVAGDDEAGYTITNVGLDMPVVVTSAKTLSTELGGTPAKFTFAKRGDKGNVAVTSISNDGVWEMDKGLGPARARVQIRPEDTQSSLQEFNLVRYYQ
ncbi:unnamed protein product [Mycena citricolor]|uniref:Uncharacterized protein n=1 Tax=Mycena citricolor TaxID=2018698 RepID=A0AAD2JX52_9AGAR|nr:unnamed protein product [Mycena citricolor]